MKGMRWVAAIVAIPLVLFFILATCVYLPPLQNWAVRLVSERLSEEMNMQISVERVRLAFPLDLALHGACAVQDGDTIVDVEAVRLGVCVAPLLHGKVKVDEVLVCDMRLNTRDYVSDVHVRGVVGCLKTNADVMFPPQGWVEVDGLLMSDADLYVALSDTAAVDTVSSILPWNVNVKNVSVENSKVHLSLPQDCARAYLVAEKLTLGSALLNLEKSDYTIRDLNGDLSQLRYVERQSQGVMRGGNTAFRVFPINRWDDVTSTSCGFNPSCIDCSEVSFTVRSAELGADGVVRVDVPWVSVVERSGLQIKEMTAKGEMKDDQVNIEHLWVKTPDSQLKASGAVPLSLLQKGSDALCWMKVDAALGKRDISLLSSPWVDEKWTAMIPNTALVVKCDVSGGRPKVVVKDAQVKWAGIVDVDLQGEIDHPFTPERRGEVQLRADFANAAPLLQMLSTEWRRTLNIPNGTAVHGMARVEGNEYAWDGDVKVPGGKTHLEAMVDPVSEKYMVQVVAHTFPVGKVLPTLGLGNLSGKVSAKGVGFAPLGVGAEVSANVDVVSLEWQGTEWGTLTAAIDMSDGVGQGNFVVDNAIVRGNVKADVDFTDGVQLMVDGECDPIDMKKIAALQGDLQWSTALHLEAFADADFLEYGVKGRLANNRFLTAENGFTAKDLDVDLVVNPQQTTLFAQMGDMMVDAAYRGQIGGVADAVARLKDECWRQLRERDFDPYGIRKALPDMNLSMKVGTDNPLSNLLRLKGYTFAEGSIDLTTNSSLGINGQGHLHELKVDNVKLEDIAIEIGQNERGIKMNVAVENQSKDEAPQFKAMVHGYLFDEDAGVELAVWDGNGKKGIDIGVKALLENEGVRAQFYPNQPTLAYQLFQLNKDNYLYIGKNGTVGSDIQLTAHDGGAIALYSTPDTLSNDLTLSLHHIDVEKISQTLPFMPKVKGELGGDIHVIDDHKTVSAMGNINLGNFEYEGMQMGDVGLEAIYMPKQGGEHYFNAFLSANETEVMALEGTYFNNRDGYFEGKADVMEFPLHLLNGVLASTDFGLRGNAGGVLNVAGTLSQPRLDGALHLAEVNLYSDVYGLDFNMDDQPVTIRQSQVLFDDYRLYSHKSENPLQINGSVDVRNLTNPRVNLTLKAKNFELINSKKQRQSVAYGKLYTDFMGSVKGALDELTVRGNLNVLPQTNLTYILKDSPLTVDDRLEKLVKFVDFNDTTKVEPQLTRRGNFDMVLGISINEMAKFHCDLSESGDNYVDIEGGGDLTLRMTPQEDMRMTGRFTVGEGEMKYTLPVIPLKKFKIERGSYVEFTGDVMNPTLNITAKEQTKAIVTENDVPRSVAFDVGVKVSRQLSDMGLEFIIDAPEDLSMQNQLSQMTNEQRGKTAVSLLATGMFLNDEMLSTGKGFKASNALTAFLQSEIQNIAGSALRTIDLSVGMDQGVGTAGTSTTDYSFQFAKRFWGNRISVIVGGKVSTGGGATNTAESFIDNVAVEYRLDKGSSRYVRAFYDRGTHDPFEGQLTKTGVGLVLRRKTNKLGELFIFRNKKDEVPIPQDTLHGADGLDNISLDELKVE